MMNFHQLKVTQKQFPFFSNVYFRFAHIFLHHFLLGERAKSQDRHDFVRAEVMKDHLGWSKGEGLIGKISDHHHFHHHHHHHIAKAQRVSNGWTRNCRVQPIIIDLFGGVRLNVQKGNYSTWRRDFVEMTHDFRKRLQ